MQRNRFQFRALPDWRLGIQSDPSTETVLAVEPVEEISVTREKHEHVPLFTENKWRAGVRFSQLKADECSLSHVLNPDSVKIIREDGRTLRKDPEEAFRWNLTAAKAGIQRAQFTVACMYRDGTGTPKDNAEADRWFAASVRTQHLDQYIAASKASADDEATAVRLRELLLSTCSQRAVNQAERMGANAESIGLSTDSRGRLRKAAETLERRCSEKEAAKAVATLEELAASGDSDAMMVLAGLYKEGSHLAADEESYKKYVRMAAELGNRRATTIVDRWERRNRKRSKKRSGK